MISLERYDDRTQTILDPKEIELKIEYGFKQHLVVLDKIIKESFYLDIKSVINNPHLKEVNLSFDNGFVSSELLNIFNDKTHIIKNVKMEFILLDMKDLDSMYDDKKNKIVELKQTIMYIDDIEIKDGGMTISLCGHMVV